MDKYIFINYIKKEKIKKKIIKNLKKTESKEKEIIKNINMQLNMLKIKGLIKLWIKNISESVHQKLKMYKKWKKIKWVYLKKADK